MNSAGQPAQVYLAAQPLLVVVTGYRAGHSVPGIAWTAVTAAAMFALATGKARTGQRSGTRYSPQRAASH